MAEVARYTRVVPLALRFDVQGEFVTYRDYLTLQAECERLRGVLNEVSTSLKTVIHDFREARKEIL